MPIESHGHEHEFEPQFGLPERLPSTERILWQGSPDFRALAISAFHLRKLAAYFLALIAIQGALLAGEGAGVGAIAASLLRSAVLAVLGLACVASLAWLTARTAVYTLTDKRVVMRIGVVLTLSFNLPLSRIESASYRATARDTGDIVLRLAGRDRIAWLHLWPHVRPWRIARPEPMLRAIPQADVVANQLARAWSEATGISAASASAPAAGQTQQPRPSLQPSLT